MIVLVLAEELVGKTSKRGQLWVGGERGLLAFSAPMSNLVRVEKKN